MKVIMPRSLGFQLFCIALTLLFAYLLYSALMPTPTWLVLRDPPPGITGDIRIKAGENFSAPQRAELVLTSGFGTIKVAGDVVPFPNKNSTLAEGFRIVFDKPHPYIPHVSFRRAQPGTPFYICDDCWLTLGSRPADTRDSTLIWVTAKS
ncbi:MAG: hypothetical protein ING60_04025 [Rhodocyclaceae bacterium]|nr:hypothetical protein [Rhodocyclaceae bacterium]